MAMQACPHCGGPGITTFRWYSLGPVFPATCRTCGRKIGVPWAGLLAILPFLLAVAARPFIPHPWGWVAVAAGLVAMFALWRYVPLVKR